MAALKAEDFKEENMNSIELENICAEIFLKCDKNSKKYVEVSMLITFIAPFIDSDQHLCELKKIIDPLDMNPTVTFDVFLNAMKIWSARFNNVTSFVSNDRSQINKRLSDEFKQSTPTKESVEKGLNKNDFDCGLNVSNISSYSCAGSVQSACDPIFLNEQINELQHQNKKLLESLNEVSQQLANSEEINNNLQNDFDRLKKSYQSDQKLLEDYQKMKLEVAKEREETNILMKNHSSVVQSLNFYKKENSQLRKNILEYETEVQKNQELITSLHHKESKLTIKIDKYKNELEVRNNENSALQDKINELSTMCLEKDNYIKKISSELENLRSDNIALNKRIDDITNENTSFKPSKPDSETNPITDTETEASFVEVFQETEKQKEESLQEELIKASNTECLGPHTYCSHQLKTLQYEEDIENLQNKIQQQIDEISNINKINAELNTTNIKLKADIASYRNENKRFARLEQKIKKLEDEIFEEKSKSEKYFIQNNSLQRENDRISNNLKHLENEKEKMLVENERISNNLKHLESEKEKILVENERINNNFKHLESEKEKILVEKNSLQNEFTNLEKKLRENIYEKENIISENKNLQLNLKSLEERISDLEKFIQDEIEKENLEKLSFQTMLESKTVQLINLESEIKKLENEKNNLIIQFDTEKFQTENIKKKLKIELKNVNQKFNEMKQQLLEKENEIKKLNIENKDLKNKNNELICEVNNLSKSLELLEQTKHHLENELFNENLKLKSLTDVLSELTDKNASLDAKNEKNLTRISKLLQNISNLEQKLQNLRKSNIDLNSSKTEVERNLKVVSAENENFISHMHFVQKQIKECRHVLGLNTLNVSKIWKPDLDTILPGFSIEELTDEGSLSGMMKISEGMLTEDVKNLRNQTRLTGIMLKALAKIKQDEILAEEDVELRSKSEIVNKIPFIEMLLRRYVL